MYKFKVGDQVTDIPFHGGEKGEIVCVTEAELCINFKSTGLEIYGVDCERLVLMPKTKKLWINLYAPANESYTIPRTEGYHTKEDANRDAELLREYYITTVEAEWEEK